MKYFCNPVNVNYRYQFNKPMQGDKIQVSREAADPSMICFHGKYYIFASMTLGVWVSDDLVSWENHRLPDNLPLYDYAPDVRVLGDYVYFSASRRGQICNFYRTKDILNGPYEEIEGTFDFWDPNLFVDDDGRVYFYWGCANVTPVWGVELDPETMHPLSERIPLIYGKPLEKGYERVGEDHSAPPLTEAEIEERLEQMLSMRGQKKEDLPPEMLAMARGFLSNNPYIEGAWMDKYKGKYYLQYACPGAEYNVYADGVYVSDKPLGPFTLAENNPFSYKPGGFIPGAGHGSTMWDLSGNLWHTSTMRISVNHNFERRVGLWPAGFDADGELYCNQRYGDWPMAVTGSAQDPWKNPEWFLLSYGKPVTCSSHTEGKGPELAVDENVRTWWQAADAAPGQWLAVDLGKALDVRAVQINFADDQVDVPLPGEMNTDIMQPRYIDGNPQVTRWVLSASVDGETYFVLEDKSDAETNLPHDLVVRPEGISARYIRLEIREIPYDQRPCISGLRVFGIGDGEKPAVPEFTATRVGDLNMDVQINGHAVGYNILWGHRPDKLYHSYMIFGKTRQNIGALVKGQNYFVRVDAFNENGITEGTVKAI